MRMQLDPDRIKDALYRIERVFNEFQKMQSVKAVPFIISAKGIKLDCDYLYGGKVLEDKSQTYYCAFPEHVEQYLDTGAKIITCKECPNYKQ